jgi:hypothetical protein
MKLISAFYVAATIGVASLSWKYLEPLVVQNGTAVISIMTNDGKSGDKPMTMKLPSNLSQKQLELLNFAYEVAKTDGITHPQYLQGIIMQESKAGGMSDYRVAGLSNKQGDRYFGIGQMKLVAAKAVMLIYPEMWQQLETRTEEELQAKLILDDKFNIRMASKYMLLMGINKNPEYAVTAYNQGPGGAKSIDPATWHYNVGVKKQMAALK